MRDISTANTADFNESDITPLPFILFFSILNNYLHDLIYITRG